MSLDIRIDPLTLPLAVPVATARGTVFERTGVVISARDERGAWGRGELSPLAGWSSIDLDEGVAALEAWAASPQEASAPAPVPAGAAPEVRAAIDSLRWTLQAAQVGQPLWRLLGGQRGQVDVNALAVGATPGALVEHALELARAGTAVVKVKLGMGDDLERIDALAATPNGPRIRLDANAAWGAHAPDLLVAAHGMLGGRLDYVEDPVDDLDAALALAADTGCPVALDELVRDPADVDRAVASAAPAAVVVKPALLGGITPVLDMASRLRPAGVRVVVSSLYDGPVGLGVWCHLAAALGPGEHHGLGTASLFSPGVADHLLPRRGVIVL